MYWQRLDVVARENARVAFEAAEKFALFLGQFPPDGGAAEPTALDGWSVRDVAAHRAHASQLFAAQVRQALPVAPHMAPDMQDEFQSQSLVALGRIMTDASRDLQWSMQYAKLDHLTRPVLLPFGYAPVWSLVSLAACEAVLHHWDVVAPRDPQAVISADWVLPIAKAILDWMPHLCRPEAISSAVGTYLLEVEAGIGPLSIFVSEDSASAHLGRERTPELVLDLTADQYLRMLFCRLDLRSAVEEHAIEARGDIGRLDNLARLFGGFTQDDPLVLQAAPAALAR